MTAALYALRGGHSVKIIERENFGGQIADSPRVENFPSIKTISGLDFSNNLFEQISALGVEFELDEIKSISKNDGFFAAHGTYGDYEGESLILAPGVKHRALGAPGEKELVGKGVSYCAVCDGAFYKGQDVMVIGDANSALQYAILLASECHHVDVVTLFDHFFADAYLVKALLELPNVSVFHEYNTKSFNGTSELESVTFINTKTKEEKTFTVKAAFVAIGQIPDNERFLPLVELEKGYIKVNDEMATLTPGLFAAGDARTKKIRQLTTAVNDGAIAALSAATYLIKKSQS